jgi:thioredoxin-related protein
MLLSMITRRTLIGAAAAFALARRAGAEARRIEPSYLDDGRPTQSWFINSFLILKEDLADSAAQGKRLAVLWDQRGCPACLAMHRTGFGDPGVSAYIRERFNIVQLDLLGPREVTDFDGAVLSEKDLARKYDVIGTPTIQFLPPAAQAVEGRQGRAVEVARMTGYKPEQFLAMFEYVAGRAYERQPFDSFAAASKPGAGLTR